MGVVVVISVQLSSKKLITSNKHLSSHFRTLCLMRIAQYITVNIYRYANSIHKKINIKTTFCAIFPTACLT